MVYHVIQSGDTLQGISQRIYGSTEYWTLIADANNLVYPYIIKSTETVEGTVKPGDTLSIPDLENIQRTETSMYSDILLDNVTSSVTQIDSTGNMVADGYGDIKTCSAEVSLFQDLTHRLTTEEGTLHHHPLYGSTFLSIIGSKATSTWKQKAVVELVRVFRSDYRVVDIKNISITDVTTGVSVYCEVVHTNGVLQYNTIV